MTIMTTITVASLRGLPAMAIEGKASIIMYLVPAILFLVPTALVGAELASTYQGGIYVWVKEAFGNKWGFWRFGCNGFKMSCGIRFNWHS